MNQALIAAAVSLAHTLTEENAALRALDIPRAVALLARKQADWSALAQAQSMQRALSGEQRALAQQVAARLNDAAAENKRLLERAIAVQREVIATILRAAPESPLPTRYGAARTPQTRARPVTLSHRV